jgi:hypothetical protein
MSGLGSVTGSAAIFALHVGAGHSPGQVQGPLAGLSLPGRTSAARANWQQQLASSVEQLGPASPRVSEASPGRAQQQEPPTRWKSGDRPAISNMAQESTTGTRTTTAARRRDNPDDPGRAMPLL